MVAQGEDDSVVFSCIAKSLCLSKAKQISCEASIIADHLSHSTEASVLCVTITVRPKEPWAQ